MQESVQTECLHCNSRSRSVFCNVEDSDLQRLDGGKKHIHLKKGEPVFLEGSYPGGLYCIEHGKVKIFQLGVDGKEQILHLACDGDVMGYRAIMSGDRYSCSAIAIEDSSICYIPKSIFQSLVQENSKVAMEVIRLLSKELRDAEMQITRIAQRPVKERIANSILLLKNRYGFEADQKTIDVVISREEIANIAGTTRETAIRILSDFNQHKVIELKGKKIRILDQKELTHAANVFE